MRYLMLMTLGFTGGLCLCAYLHMEAGVLSLVLCCALFGAFSQKLRRPALILGGLGLGLFWFSLFETCYLQPALALEGETAQVTVTVTDHSRANNQGETVDGVIRLEGKPYRVRLYMQEGEAFQPGDRLRGSFSFRTTLSHEKPGYQPGQGIFLIGVQREKSIRLSPENRDPWTLPARLRKDIGDRIRDIFPLDTSGFARALLLGDSEALTSREDWNLSTSGIRHVVAVSGLHVSILWGLISLLTFRRRWLTCLLGLPVLALFCSITGFTPSVVRASVMAGLMMVASLAQREYDPLTELSFAVLVMTLLNPMVVTSVSFQLSAFSVLGILLFYQKLHSWLMKPFLGMKGIKRRLANWICGSAGVSFSALIFVTPLCALYFGSVSLVAPLTNLLTLWAVTAVFVGILVTLAVSLASLGAAAFLASLLSFLIRYILFAAGLLSRLPISAVYTDSIFICLWIAGVYLLGFLLLSGKRKHPWYLLSLGTLGLCIALALSWIPARRDSFRATILDVGQGQCILLQSEGKHFLVDCGGTRDRDAADIASRRLLSQGVFSLDGLVLTHFDRDHVGGAPALLERVPADAVYVPDTEAVSGDGWVTVVKNRMDLPLPHGKMTIFGGGDGETPNDLSLCVLFDTESYDILITGDRSRDGEALLLEQFPIPGADCLVAGHHGAASSTGEELLTAVRPETVVISAGRGNRYGHPAPETLMRLRKFGCRILRTDRDGTVFIRR